MELETAYNSTLLKITDVNKLMLLFQPWGPIIDNELLFDQPINLFRQVCFYLFVTLRTEIKVAQLVFYCRIYRLNFIFNVCLVSYLMYARILCPAWWRSGYYTYLLTRKYRLDPRWRHI